MTNNDKKSIEGLIADFSAQQLLADDSSDKFSDMVDMSLSNSQLDRIKTNMLSVAGKQKATWITSYLQGQQNYASVKCRELVQGEDGKITELVVTYDFIYKGGKWKIYDYQIGSRVSLDTTDLTTKNALCVVTPGSVDSLVSQVSTETKSDEDGKTETSSSDDSKIGEVVEYDEYKPVLKEKNTNNTTNNAPADNNAGMMSTDDFNAMA